MMKRLESKIIKQIIDLYTISFKSKKIASDLAAFGVVQRKTFSVALPALSDAMMPHLIRGLIDGDGWISEKSRAIGFCGNETIVAQVRDYLFNTLGVYRVSVSHTGEHLWQCVWCSKKDISIIGSYIYQDKQDCFLVRKYNNFMLIPR